MSEPEYWFARRFPPGYRRRGMTPVHWKGWAVMGGFVGGMALGAALFGAIVIFGVASLGVVTAVVTGGAVFAIVAAASATLLIVLAYKRGDQQRWVGDYRGAHGRAQGDE